MTMLQSATAIIKEFGPTIIIVGTLIGMFSGAVAVVLNWAGKRSSKFVKDTVLPEIQATRASVQQLTGSVDSLSKRTHENTTAIDAFTHEQAKINTDHATAIARIRGQLGDI